MKLPQIVHAGVAVIFLAGCSSIKSTHVERDASLCGWRTTRLHGTPITLTVPHHYKITIRDVYYVKGGVVLRDVQAPNLPIRTRGVSFDVEESQEIFTVDFVKPGAGSLKTSAKFDADTQYFTAIDNKIEDSTIKEITNSVNTITNALKPLSTNRSAIPKDPTITELEKIVAVKYIEVADPQAKEKIQQFLCDHLNSCSGCCDPLPTAGHSHASTSSRPGSLPATLTATPTMPAILPPSVPTASR